VPRNCPSDQALLAFHLGTLPEAEIDAVTEHLESCPGCDAALQRLDSAADPLLAALRKSLPVTTSRVERDGTNAAGPEATAPESWPSIPGYEVLGPLGRGGMGVVYRARQLRLNRDVALKELRTGNERETSRARVEAQALARLQHPNVVQIHEVVDHAGRNYLALELVEGGSLATKLQGKPRAAREAAALLETVARAVQYAHANGIIHRDLKPANILLDFREAPPQRLGSPKIADFGVAKWLSADCGETRDGDVIGSASYMAPEQASGNVGAIGPATDVYSLGVILYELLTGRIPLQGTSTLETLLLVRGEEPVPPRRLQPAVPRDLETICLKCLHKEPGKRYRSAEALADDLRRFLSGEPIRARPASAWERAWKWARRRPAVAALSAALLLVAALGFGLVAWQWRRAEKTAVEETAARQDAQDKERQEKEARRQVEKLLAGTALDHGATLCESGEVGRGLLWLVRSLELATNAGDGALQRAARCNLSGWQPFFLRRLEDFAHDGWVWDIAFSRDSRLALTGGYDKTARLWDAATGRALCEPLRHAQPVWAVTLSPDGKTALVGTGAATDSPTTAPGEARLWDTATGRLLEPPLPTQGRVRTVAFSPNGQTFLTVCSEEACLWQTADRQQIGPPMKHPRPAKTDRRVQTKLTAAFSPDGKTIATGGEDGTARLWDATTAQARGEPLAATGPVLALAFSPDSKTLLTGSFDGGAQMWDVATGQRHGPTLRHDGRILVVAFSPDGQVAATGGAVEEHNPEIGKSQITGGTVRLWKTASGRRTGAPLQHPHVVWSLAFSPRGRTMLTGCEDGHARFFLVATGAPIGKPLPHDGLVRAVAFSPDGAVAATASTGVQDISAARRWQPPPEQALAKPLWQPGQLRDLTLSPDGRTLLTGADDGIARLWDLSTGRPVGPGLAHEGPVHTVAFSPDGQTFLTLALKGTGGQDGFVRLWDRATGRQRCGFPTPSWVLSAAFSPDGGTILGGDYAGKFHLWEAVTGKPLDDPVPDHWLLASVAFSPDGRMFVTGSRKGARLWDRGTRRVLQEWKSPLGSTQVAFYADGKRVLLVAGGIGQAWEVDTGRVTGQPPFSPEGGIGRLAFGSDGCSILISGSDGVTRLWDVVTGKRLGPPLGREQAGPVAFSAHGRTLAAGGPDGKIALWEPPLPLEGTTAQVRTWVEVLTGMELDAEGAIHALQPDVLQKRRQRQKELGGPPRIPRE
jgi:WD40 repeat protein/tRNA A-37 threonylcarbamoyl transferase component Bud32